MNFNKLLKTDLFLSGEPASSGFFFKNKSKLSFHSKISFPFSSAATVARIWRGGGRPSPLIDPDHAISPSFICLNPEGMNTQALMEEGKKAVAPGGNNDGFAIKKGKSQNNPLIFTKKINTKYKLVPPFKVFINTVGNTKYLPPVSKEWKNTIYNYDYNNSVHFPVNDLHINSLIKGYFSLYFNYKFINHNYMSRKKKRKSFIKIFVSKAEIKHTSEKAIITLYVFNKQRSFLKKMIIRLRRIIFKHVKGKQHVHYLKRNEKLFYVNRLYNLRMGWYKFISKFTNEIIIKPFRGVSSYNLNYWSIFFKNRFGVKKSLRFINRKFFMNNERSFKKIREIFSIIRRFNLKWSLNKNKFEEKFLNKLANYISKYYGKKIEFNIVNLKSVSYNSDIFNDILTTKIKIKNSPPINSIDSLLAKVFLPKVNTIIERGRLEKQVDYELLENKYKNLSVSYIINKLSSPETVPNFVAFGSQSQKLLSIFWPYLKTNLPFGGYAHGTDILNILLYSIYYKAIINEFLVEPGQKTLNIFKLISCFGRQSEEKALNEIEAVKIHNDLNVEKWNKSYSLKLRNIIFENIKYKIMAGTKIIVNGRLTKRYRADRAVHKCKWKGGLKNIDSAFKGLSTVIFKGYQDSNVVMSKSASKRRIGSFGVKTWMAGK